VCVFVGIEDIDDRVFADGEDEAIGGLRAAELVQVRIKLFRLPAQIDGLAQEGSLNQKVGLRLPDLVRFTTGISRDTESVAEPETLVGLRVESEFSSRPRPDTGVKGYVKGLARLFMRIETVGSAERRCEAGMVLRRKGGLSVNGPALQETNPPDF
jgi:hypothetical protein